MLTHFHNDHYKGYIGAYKDADIKFPEPFNIYMPWVSFERKNRTNLAILVCESIYLYMIYKQVDDRKSFLFWLKGQIEFIINISNENTRIILLRGGDIFSIGEEEMEVLWPQIIPIEDDKGIREAELREIFQKNRR